MTNEQNIIRPSAPLGADDPLANLSAAEITAVTDALTAAGRLHEHVSVVYLGLREPHKARVYAARAGGEPVPRIARVLLLDTAAGTELDLDVSVSDGTVISERTVDASVGRLPVTDAECILVGEILAADPAWRTAMARRTADVDRLVYAAQTAGNFPDLLGNDRRILRALAFLQDHPTDLAWAHPVAGVYATVDLITREVLAIVDDELLPIPEEAGNYDDPAFVGPAFEGLRPIEITQPQGPSFTLDGHELGWARWKLSIGFDAREGLILRDLRYTDGDRDRPVAYRASIAEMVVPYGDPTSTRSWQTYFDVGEFLFGRYTNSLRLGCDCLGEIRYLDAVLSDERGRPRVIGNAICIHEEDVGVLWKHEDMFTGSKQVRRNRRLVISSFTTVGNYDYGFYWYLYLDGTIECEAKLNGIVFTSAYRDAIAPHASHLAPGLAAPYHQHLFTARLDMTVDGVANAVDEIDVERLPMSVTNPRGNAFTKRVTRLDSEPDSGRLADASVGRVWSIVSTERCNRMGEPTGYALLPDQNPTLLAAPESSIAARNRYLSKHLWVTAYDPAEQYPAGDFANQSTGVAELSNYARADRPIDGADIVLWHVFGPTHFPRLEDWPIMPVDFAHFTLRPLGFFDRNPVLDVPPSSTPGGHCGSIGTAST